VHAAGVHVDISQKHSKRKKEKNSKGVMKRGLSTVEKTNT